MALLDAIFDGLTHEEDGALRDFCADAAREFLLWSAKHVTAKTSQAGANLNAASLLRRLFERLAHPKPYQRYFLPKPGIPVPPRFIACPNSCQEMAMRLQCCCNKNLVLRTSANAHTRGASSGP